MLKLNKKQFILVVLLSLVFIYIAVSLFNIWSASSYGKFVKISDMNVPRTIPRTILLKDGRVFIFGGESTTLKDGQDAIFGTNIITKNNTAEVFDPKTGKFDFLADSLKPLDSLKMRVHNSITLLPNGKILIAGGRYLNECIKSTIFFNPKTNKFEQGPDMNYHRAHHTATLLPNGNVLIAGGVNYSLGLRHFKKTIENAEIYDYRKNKFILDPKIQNPKQANITLSLKNGNVLFFGNSSPIEMYDYKNNILKTSPNNQNINISSLIELSNDRFLTAGSEVRDNLTLINLYQVQNNKIQKIQSFETKDIKARSFCFTKLDDNRILITGGLRGVVVPLLIFPLTLVWQSADAYIYDIKNNRLIKISKMNLPHSDHSCLKIAKGKVLIIGGYSRGPFGNDTNETKKAEMFVYKENK